MKYADKGGEVRMLITEKHPFKGKRTTLLTLSSTKILLRLMRIPIQRTPTLVMKLTQNQDEKNASAS